MKQIVLSIVLIFSFIVLRANILCFSAIEQLIIDRDPLEVFVINPESYLFTEKRNIPTESLKGYTALRLLTFDEDRKKFYLWLDYNDYDPEKGGLIYVFDISRPKSSTLFQIATAPTFGGYFIDEPDAKFVTIKDFKKCELTYISTGKSVFLEFNLINWNKVFLDGGWLGRPDNSWINLNISKEGIYWVKGVRGKIFKFDFHPTAELLNNLIKTDDINATLRINNHRLFVAYAGVPNGCNVIIYDKLTSKWNVVKTNSQSVELRYIKNHLYIELSSNKEQKFSEIIVYNPETEQNYSLQVEKGKRVIGAISERMIILKNNESLSVYDIFSRKYVNAKIPLDPLTGLNWITTSK